MYYANMRSGTPGRIRTCNQRIRSPLLCPIELRARCLCRLSGTISQCPYPIKYPLWTIVPCPLALAGSRLCAKWTLIAAKPHRVS